MAPPFSTLLLGSLTKEGPAENARNASSIGPTVSEGAPGERVELHLSDPKWAGRIPAIPVIYRFVREGRVVEREVPSRFQSAAPLPSVIVRGNLDSPVQLAAGIMDALGRAGWVPLAAASIPAASLPDGPAEPRRDRKAKG